MTTAQEMATARIDDLNSLAYFLCGNSMQAIEATRVAIDSFIARYDQSPPQDEASAVLFQTVIKEIQRFIKKKTLSPPTDPSPIAKENLFDLLAQSPKSNVSIPFALSSINDTLLELDPDIKIPLLLRDMFRLDFDLIASIMNVPETTISHRINLGRSYLINAFKRKNTSSNS